jgi:translation initiation factor IF-3
MLINEEIRLKEVRVIGPEGEAIGIMSSDDALRMAYDKGYDLVLMAPQAQPPVCKIMDYGKYRFERDKKEKEVKKKQAVVELKEIQLSCRIDTHDFETKARHAHKFLESGNKVRVVMRFKGREMSHMAIGQEIMQKFRESCEDVGAVDKAPVLDGRLLSMVISPVKQK